MQAVSTAPASLEADHHSQKRQKVEEAAATTNDDAPTTVDERAAAKAAVREAVSERPELTAALYKQKKSKEDPTPFGGTVARYYLEHYYLDVHKQPYHDMYVYLHSNKLVVVGVAASHPLISLGDPIVRIETGSIKGKGVETFEVSGKLKKGGAVVSQSNVLCTVTTSKGTSYDIHSPLPGKIIEFNDRILETPDLLRTKPLTSGFVAILSPKVEQLSRMPSSSSTKKEYLARLRTLSDGMYDDEGTAR